MTPPTASPDEERPEASRPDASEIENDLVDSTKHPEPKSEQTTAFGCSGHPQNSLDEEPRAATEDDARSNSDEASTSTPDDAEVDQKAAGGAEIQSDAELAFMQVPSIGEGYRWYDFPYNFLTWLLGSWRRRILSDSMRRRINRGRNYLIPFNEVQRERAYPRRRAYLDAGPGSEQMTMGSTWVVELFPPSKSAALLRGLRSAGWDTDRVHTGVRQTSNQEMVTKSRSGSGWSWWRLGEVARKDSQLFLPDAIRDDLPDGMEYVELKAVQLGSSITAVVARFSRTEEGERRLNQVWHSNHGPRLVWRGWKRPSVDDTYFATIRTTLKERQKQHDAARRWLATKLPGYFAKDFCHPVIDFCLFEQFDPLAEGDDRGQDAKLRALGLGGYPGLRLTSPQVPEMALVPHGYRHSGDADAALQECWALVANHGRANAAYEGRRLGYEGSRDTRFYSHHLDEFVQEFLLVLAMSKYERVAVKRLSILRDAAQDHQGTVSARDLLKLRSDLLERSLELTWVARDTKRLWQTGGFGWAPIKIKATDRYATETRDLSFDYTNRIKNDLRQGFKTLIEEDARYRDVLASAASLGSSAEGTRLARWALMVSLFSLLVVVMTLLATEPGPNSLWNILLEAVLR